MKHSAERSGPYLQPKQTWWVAACLGAVTVATLIWIASISPPTGCGATVRPPSLAFQMARTSADLAAIFGMEPSTCQIAIRGTLATATKVDLFIFIPLYAGFLSFLFMGLQPMSRLLSGLLILALAATMSGDVLETTVQLWIIARPASGAAWLPLLAAGNSIKVIGLAVVLLGLSRAINARGHRIDRVIAALTCFCAIARLIGFAFVSAQGVVPLASLAAYTVLALYAGLRAATYGKSNERA